MGYVAEEPAKPIEEEITVLVIHIYTRRGSESEQSAQQRHVGLRHRAFYISYSGFRFVFKSNSLFRWGARPRKLEIRVLD